MALLGRFLGWPPYHQGVIHVLRHWVRLGVESVRSDDLDAQAPMGEIRHAGVQGALVVVTRWFGGTKLGTGGLARAYGEAARLALSAAPRREVRRLATLALEFTFDDLGTVESLLAKQRPAVPTIERAFGDGARFRVEVRRSRAEMLRSELVEATRGRIRVAVIR